jgi:hypothetical protein
MGTNGRDASAKPGNSLCPAGDAQLGEDAADVVTVPRLITSRSAISGLFKPATMKRSTSAPVRQIIATNASSRWIG